MVPNNPLVSYQFQNHGQRSQNPLEHDNHNQCSRSRAIADRMSAAVLEWRGTIEQANGMGCEMIPGAYSSLTST